MTANFALRVAGAQIPVGTDIKANTANLLRAIDIAVGKGADILLTPEGSLSGYTHEFDTAAAEHALVQVTTAAAGKNLGLALGTCYFEGDGRCYNQVRFYTRDGAYLGFHSKTLTCGSLTDPPRGEIERYAVAPLRVYNWPGVRLGGLICNDLWANPGCTPQPDPHLTQQLAGLGARRLGGQHAAHLAGGLPVLPVVAPDRPGHQHRGEERGRDQHGGDGGEDEGQLGPPVLQRPGVRQPAAQPPQAQQRRQAGGQAVPWRQRRQ